MAPRNTNKEKPGFLPKLRTAVDFLPHKKRGLYHTKSSTIPPGFLVFPGDLMLMFFFVILLFTVRHALS